MGFKPFKAVTRALGIPDPVARAVFPVHALADVVASKGIEKLQNVIQPSAKQAAMPQPFVPGPTTIYYQGGDAAPPAYSVYFADESIYGGARWDFSTDSWETYSENSRRTWPATGWGDYLLV